MSIGGGARKALNGASVATSSFFYAMSSIVIMLQILVLVKVNVVGNNE